MQLARALRKVMQERGNALQAIELHGSYTDRARQPSGCTGQERIEHHG
jgi:hypothetical protein